MYFGKSIEDLTIKDISDFCKSNSEDYRVEYKSVFNKDVRRNIPKIVSAFANAHGGILMIEGCTHQSNVKWRKDRNHNTWTARRHADLSLVITELSCIQSANPR